ncbi:MAG: ABC transporter ATP-binding protein [Eubacteriales bacterium]|nr:ABC transporter ATP-binding protein [Eubacteriales bacterium]
MQNRKLRLTGTLMRDNKWYFLAALICTVFTVIIEFITPILLAETLDYYLQGKPSRMPGFINAWVNGLGGREFMARNLWIVGLALVGLNILSGVFSFSKGRSQAVAGENVSLYLREKLYGHIQRLPFSYHVKAETGDLVQRCTSDVETVRRFLAGQLMQVVNAVMMIGFALFYLLRENVKITLISMILVPVLFLFAWLFFKWVIKSFRLADESEGKMSAVLQENLTGVRVVRAFGRQEYEVEKFEAANSDLKKKNFKICNLLAVYWATSDALSMIQSMLTLLTCVFFAIRGEITVGTLTIFTSYIWKLLWPIRQLGRILSDAGKSSVAMERIDEILRQPEEPAEPDAIKPSLKGDIVFDHVTFAYADGRDVLKDMSFTIPHGKTVAILGATGSGKSSVVHLIQRLFEPKKGEIRIGGTPINKIDRYYLRSRVGLVLQEPFLYSRTLKENVAIAVPNATDEAIDQAVQDAAAKAFILESDKGFETLVGERGVTLSGGQKQRVAIARTLMKDNDILIFDDSLSAVDTETDAQIRAALKRRSKDTTTIIISHRIVTLSQADLILVMEDGRVTEQGTHDQLIHSGGLYSKIFNIQTALEEEFKEENTGYAAV